MKDEFFRGATGRLQRGVQGRPRGLHRALEHEERQGQAEGPGPGRVPGAGPSGRRVATIIYRVQVLGRSSDTSQVPAPSTRSRNVSASTRRGSAAQAQQPGSTACRRRRKLARRHSPTEAYRVRPPRTSMASQNSSRKRGSEAAMSAFVAIQPDGVPVS